MGRLTSTLLLVVILAGLGAYIYFVDSNMPAASTPDGAPGTRDKLFTVDLDKVNELRVTYKGESTLLKKSEAGWKLFEPAQVDADPAEAIGVATALNGVEVVRVVDENPTDLAKFGLDKPQIVVDFKVDGGPSGSLKLGNKNPTQSEIFALKNDEKRVVLVSSFQETSFNRTAFDLRDKKMLKFDRDKADSLVLAKGATSMELSRSGTDWKVVKPVAARSDYALIEGFIGRLASSNMARLVEENATDLAKYGLDKPEMTVTIGAGSAKTVLQVGRTDNEDTYARDAARPMVFTLDSAVQVDLKKSFDDYRKKELFEFRPFSLAKMRAVLDAPGGAKTYEFEKVKGAKPEDPETWKVTRVGGASHTADQAAMDDLLNKLVAIRAASFAESAAKTGVDKPALVVSVSFDDGKFERVRFGRVGDNAFGVRDGEAGVAKIDEGSMAAAMKAFDEVTLPKENKPDPKAGDKK